MYILNVGIDVGNSFCVLFGLADTGEVVLDARKLPTMDDEAWRDLFEELSRRYICRACFEIGPHYEWLYDLLCEYCREVVVVNPADFAVISRSQRKTDKVDACKLAEGLIRGDLPSVWIPDCETRADRRLVAFVHWHSQRLSSLKGRIRALLFPYRLRCPHSDVLGQAGRDWLLTVASRYLDGQGRLFLRMLVEHGSLLIEQRRQLDGLVRIQVDRYPQADIMRSIPGFGNLTSLAVLSAVGEIDRFRKSDELPSYFGVCGSVYQSGKTLRFGSMTKRGNGHVRWLLSQALKHLHAKDPKARRRYERMKRGKHVGVARGAQMRWLSRIIWYLLKKNEKYRIEQPSVKASVV